VAGDRTSVSRWRIVGHVGLSDFFDVGRGRGGRRGRSAPHHQRNNTIMSARNACHCGSRTCRQVFQRVPAMGPASRSLRRKRLRSRSSAVGGIHQRQILTLALRGRGMHQRKTTGDCDVAHGSLSTRRSRPLPLSMYSHRRRYLLLSAPSIGRTVRDTQVRQSQIGRLLLRVLRFWLRWDSVSCLMSVPRSSLTSREIVGWSSDGINTLPH
jgi:hypothetical protein